MKITIDKDYTVGVKTEYLRKKFSRNIKINENGLVDDISSHLYFHQYCPWDDRNVFVDYVKRLIEKWCIKKNYGKLEIKCFDDEHVIDDNSRTYIFRVRLGMHDEVDVFVDVKVRYKSTWMQNMMMDCEKKIRELMEAVIYTGDDRRDDQWVEDIKNSMGYIPGCVCMSGVSNMFHSGHVYFAMEEKTKRIFLIDWRRGVNDDKGLVHYVSSGGVSDVDTFVCVNVKFNELDVYVFGDEYFGNMFIDVYKKR